MAEVEDPAKAQVELDYAVSEDEGGDSDLVVEIKGLYKDLALALVEKLPEGRSRFLALNELNGSKGWAVEATAVVLGEEPVVPENGGNGGAAPAKQTTSTKK